MFPLVGLLFGLLLKGRYSASVCFPCYIYWIAPFSPGSCFITPLELCHIHLMQIFLKKNGHRTTLQPPKLSGFLFNCHGVGLYLRFIAYDCLWCWITICSTALLLYVEFGWYHLRFKTNCYWFWC